MTLPPPTCNQAYCDVSALEAGHIGLADEMFITTATKGAVTSCPSLSFLLQHTTNSQKFVFDLGIRKDWQNLPPTIVDWIRGNFPLEVPQDVAESLIKGGISPDDINTVCLSHCHFDHSGDTSLFTKSIFLVGEECQSLFTSSFPSDPKSLFAADLLPTGRTRYIKATEWQAIGPFPRAFDFYGDGSLYVIDAPGHLPGHVNLLARTSSDGAWIYLAGDSAHFWQLITGEAEVAMGHPGHFHSCAHADKELADESIARIRKVLELPRVRVIIAHDAPWYQENKGGPAFLPGKIPTL